MVNTRSYTKLLNGTCKICFDSGTEEDPLLTPCLCKGTSAYVHGSCLYKWYQINNERGLECSICKYTFSIEHSYPLEVIPIIDRSSIKSIYRPYFLFLIAHYLFINLLLTIDKKISPETFINDYYIFQSLVNIVYFVSTIPDCKNKILYAKKWANPWRLSFVFFHGLLIYSIRSNGLVGGLAENIIMPLYVNEHLEILSELNSKNNIIFKSR
jgi:E3 ubiquitin-protein ligase DOA10